MQTATSRKPVGGITVKPAVNKDTSDLNPTAIRYGWAPYKAIPLTGPDGTINLYVQPHEINVAGNNVDNPLHRVLPKGQLLAFPTFNAVHFELSEDRRDSKGAAVPVQSTRTVTALEAIVSVLRIYSEQGFTILKSLQGMDDQEKANRIFRVVHPFEYKFSDYAFELTVGAEARINTVSDLVFQLDGDEEYIVEALKDNSEREIALQLAEEMAAGAEVALARADEIFNETEISIKQRLSGGQGKVGPDPHDRYLAEQLGKEFPNLGTLTGNGTSPELLNKVDYLVGREVDRAKDEEIARLKRELAIKDADFAAIASTTGLPLKTTEELEAITEPATEEQPQTEEKEAASNLGKANVGYCGRPNKNGEPCKSITRDGEPCYSHREDDEEDEAEETTTAV